MTAGTQTRGSLLPGRSTNWISGAPSGIGGLYGTRLTKVWNGGDSFPSRKSSRDPKKPLTLATVARYNRKKGIVLDQVEEVYYDGTFIKGRKGLSPNSWSCTYSYDHYPEGNALFHRRSVATDQLIEAYGHLRVSWDSLYRTNPPPLPVLTPDDEYKLISRLSNQIKGNDFNATVAGSQSLQAVAMIGETASRIAKSLSFVKKGRLVDAWDTLVRGRKAKSNRSKMADIRNKLRIREYLSKLPSGKTLDCRKTPKWLTRQKCLYLIEKLRADKARDRSNSLDSVSSDWLALQYGWLPLLSDIHGAAELLAHQQQRTIQKTYRASVTRKLDLSGRYWHSYPKPSDYYDINIAQSSISKRVIVEIEGPPNTASVLGLHDPASVAWELLPWSFVIDWFIPIGNYLESVGNVRMLNVARVITTVKKVQTVASPVFKTSISGGEKIVPIQQTGFTGFRREVTSFERTIGASLSVPLPKFKPLSEAFSFVRALNSVALLRSVR